MTRGSYLARLVIRSFDFLRLDHTSYKIQDVISCPLRYEPLIQLLSRYSGLGQTSQHDED